MAGKHAEADDSHKHPQAGEQGHHAALVADAYAPPLNHQVISKEGTIVPGKCSPGPDLHSLTIDVPNVHVHDVPRRDATPQERRDALKREMPISNEHFRDLVKGGTEYMAINDGNFNLQMKNALDEAHQSDKSMKTGHKHIDDVLKYANANLCNTDYTLRRQGNTVMVFDAHNDTKHPAGKWNLDKKAWER